MDFIIERHRTSLDRLISMKLKKGLGVENMLRKEFWEIVGKAKGDHGRLKCILSELPAQKVREFAIIFMGYEAKLYTNEVWYVADIVHIYGASDSTFTDFRSWVISKGRDFYNSIVKNPDSIFNKVKRPGKYDAELYSYVASDVYRKKTGEEIFRTKSENALVSSIAGNVPKIDLSVWELPEFRAKFSRAERFIKKYFNN